MELSEKAAAVSRMHRYIESHLDEEITFDDLVNAAGYSRYHAMRVSKELTHRTPLYRRTNFMLVKYNFYKPIDLHAAS
jgi:AraC-like DNA-binding protein